MKHRQGEPLDGSLHVDNWVSCWESGNLMGNPTAQQQKRGTFHSLVVIWQSFLRVFCDKKPRVYWDYSSFFVIIYRFNLVTRSVFRGFVWCLLKIPISVMFFL